MILMIRLSKTLDRARFGTLYIYRLVRNGPTRKLLETPHLAVQNRPMSPADEDKFQGPSYVIAGE